MSQTSISLQAPPARDAEKDTLQFLITRINEQRGSFRNVTEASLEAEIAEENAGEAIVASDADVEEGNVIEDDKAKKDRLLTARNDMLQQVGDAQQQSQMALDLVSLLLSQRTPGPAALTTSPIIKQSVPAGSVNAEVLAGSEDLGVQKQQDEMVTMGWRLQSMTKAADSLLDSASRLEKEVQKETAYWNQVLAVKEKGWSLSRLPREKHTLGVHYGFAEGEKGST